MIDFEVDSLLKGAWINGLNAVRFATLGACDLIYLHLDERRPVLTAAFEWTGTSGPLPGVSAGENAVKFCVEFNQVAEFEVRGWDCARADRFLLAAAGGRWAVNIGGPNDDTAFTCAEVSVSAVRAFRAGAW
jgi:hypothetical protein